VFVCAAGTVVTKIPKDDYDYYISGVTSVGDKLYVLLGRANDQVAVYNMNDYKLLRTLHLPEFKSDVYNDMTSCVRHKCLYMSNSDNRCIHRFDLSSSAITKWSVSGSPYGVSVTPSCNLLVTCGGQTSKLAELSADCGQCVREITLQADIECPRHAVQLTSGQFVVCHGDGDDQLHRVCLVDDEGKVTRSYGGQPGSDVGQLQRPFHLAVDGDSQFIFVVEWSNHRVVLLSQTLEFVRHFSAKLTCPHRLYFHQTTRRLYVGDYDDTVVIQV